MAALEFAFVYPLLLFLLLGIMELGYVMMIDASLETVIQSAARYGLISSSVDDKTRTERIEDTIEPVLSRWIGSTGSIDIDVRSWPSFSNIGKQEVYTDANGNGQYDEGEEFTDLNANGQYDVDLSTAGAGGSEEIIVYTVDLTTPTLTGLMSLVGIDKYEFVRSVVIQNE